MCTHIPNYKYVSVLSLKTTLTTHTHVYILKTVFFSLTLLKNSFTLIDSTLYLDFRKVFWSQPSDLSTLLGE
jgi:hypothetical protein